MRKGQWSRRAALRTRRVAGKFAQFMQSPQHWGFPELTVCSCSLGGEILGQGFIFLKKKTKGMIDSLPP